MLQRAFGPRCLPIAGLVTMIIWYPCLTLLLGFSPSRTFDFGLAFNSMAEHLLAGRFDVDPDAIGAEGFEIGDRTVAYFGIFCALLRVPLVLTPGFAKTDMTWWSCLGATWLATWFQIGAVSMVWRNGAVACRQFGTRRDWLAAGLLISVVLGGQHIQFLRPSIFQEPIDWAEAQAMGFVLLALRGWFKPHGFEWKTLSAMALCAGLALITRVSFGIGLYAALGLLLLMRGQPRTWPVPACILLIFLAITGIVNQDRWGSPFTFADFSHYGLDQDATPDRLGRLAAYGTFNLERIWLGLGYYFVPVWILIRDDGYVLFAETQATLVDAMELPPGSFFVTDPLVLGLAIIGVRAIRDRARAALLLGLAMPAMLMLFAISLTHRYRMEFYPVLFLAALFGVAATAQGAGTSRRFRVTVIGAVVAGIIASHGMAVLYARSPWGPGDFYLERYGLVGTYARSPRQ
jgi:hypothetical protein